MTSLPDRPQTALVVIDVQNDVVAGTPNRDSVIANIGVLVGKAGVRVHRSSGSSTATTRTCLAAAMDGSTFPS